MFRIPLLLVFLSVLPPCANAIELSGDLIQGGMLVGQVGYADAFGFFCAIGIVVAMFSPLYPRCLEQEPEEETEDETGLQAAYDYQLQNEEGEPYRYKRMSKH